MYIFHCDILYSAHLRVDIYPWHMANVYFYFLLFFLNHIFELSLNLIKINNL